MRKQDVSKSFLFQTCSLWGLWSQPHRQTGFCFYLPCQRPASLAGALLWRGERGRGPTDQSTSDSEDKRGIPGHDPVHSAHIAGRWHLPDSDTCQCPGHRRASGYLPCCSHMLKKREKEQRCHSPGLLLMTSSRIKTSSFPWERPQSPFVRWTFKTVTNSETCAMAIKIQHFLEVEEGMGGINGNGKKNKKWTIKKWKWKTSHL